MKRREFLKAAATAGAGLLILPSGARAGVKGPGGKLNVALIGVWGRGQAHYGALGGENVVAFAAVPGIEKPDELVTEIHRALAHHGPDDGVQTRAVTPTSENADTHAPTLQTR